MGYGQAIRSGALAMYRYVIVATSGRSWPVFEDQAGHEAANFDEADDRAVFVLPGLLRDGWLPVRETPIGEKHALVLLTREAAPSNGRPQHPAPATSA